jgi:hypothetical protein
VDESELRDLEVLSIEMVVALAMETMAMPEQQTEMPIPQIVVAL